MGLERKWTATRMGVGKVFVLNSSFRCDVG